MFILLQFNLGKDGDDDAAAVEKRLQDEDEEATENLKRGEVADMFDETADAELEMAAKNVDIDVYVNEDNWDDADGYYNLRVNEILNDRSPALSWHVSLVPVTELVPGPPVTCHLFKSVCHAGMKSLLRVGKVCSVLWCLRRTSKQMTTFEPSS